MTFYGDFKVNRWCYPEPVSRSQKCLPRTHGLDSSFKNFQTPTRLFPKLKNALSDSEYRYQTGKIWIWLSTQQIA